MTPPADTTKSFDEALANFLVPEDFAEWQLSNPTPIEQIVYFVKHKGIKMPGAMWDKFFCSSLQHKGFHCSSCLSDEEYLGQPNFDDKCCCKSELEQRKRLYGEEK